MNHLKLEFCVLSKDCFPVSDILCKKVVKYEKLSIGNIHSESPNLDDFWEKLAKTVTEIDLTDFESENLNVCEVLSHFCLLEVVAVDQQKFLKDMRKVQKEIEFGTVKKLHLYNFESDQIFCLLKFFPNADGVYIETTCEDSFPLELLQENSSIVKRLIVRASSREWTQIITELENLPNLQLETLECKVEKEQTLQFLMDFLTNQRLSTLILHTNRNLSSAIPNLKALHIDFIQDLASCKAFEAQTELQELHLKLSKSKHRFQFQYSECFFGHGSISVPSVKKLTLEEFNNKSCVECYENLFQGVSNLESLSIVQTTIATGVFDVLIQHQRKLKELRIELARISEQKIIALCEALPGLKVLDLKATVIQGCSDSIILVLCQRLPQLTELRVTMLDITESSFDHVSNHCQNLETLYLSIGGNFDLERIFRTFECLPYLKRICNILSAHDLTRIDYHEVFEGKTKSLDSYSGRRNWTYVDYYTMTWDVEEGNLTR